MSLHSYFLTVSENYNAPMLLGKLSSQEAVDNPKGITKVTYYVLNNILSVGDYQSLGNIGFEDSMYWLPWKFGTVKSVTWKELKDSQCDVFLTSEFSGCRLSITTAGISHTAYHQQTGFESFLTEPNLVNLDSNQGPYILNHSDLRSFAEEQDPIAKTAPIRRSSISNSEGGYGASKLNSKMIAAGLKVSHDVWVIREYHFNTQSRIISKMVSTQVKISS